MSLIRSKKRGRIPKSPETELLPFEPYLRFAGPSSPWTKKGLQGQSLPGSLFLLATGSRCETALISAWVTIGLRQSFACLTWRSRSSSTISFRKPKIDIFWWTAQAKICVFHRRYRRLNPARNGPFHTHHLRPIKKLEHALLNWLFVWGSLLKRSRYPPYPSMSNYQSYASALTKP